jgi:hypothetical protein
VSGSNEITITAVNRYQDDAASSVSDLSAGMAYSAGTALGNPSTGFPVYTYVQSVDAANSKIVMSENAQANIDFTDHTLFHAIVDTTRNQVVKIASDYDASGGSNTSISADDPQNNDAYGYPSTGFSASDFDVFSAGSESDYTWASFVSDYFVHRTAFMGTASEPKFRTGLVVGENTSLTNRGFGDQIQGYGINMLFDGLPSGADDKIPQILARSYTDQTFAELNPGRGGPRLFFASSFGNTGDYEFDTYPRTGQEIGRIAWWGNTGDNTAPQTTRPPALITAQAASNWEQNGATSGNINIYMAATSNKSDGADVYLAYRAGKLTLASKGGVDQSVTFAPAEINGTAPNSSYSGDYQTWANVNYANISATSGSKFTVTNGGSTVAGEVGDLQVSIHRYDSTNGGGNVSFDNNYFPGFPNVYAGGTYPFQGGADMLLFGRADGSRTLPGLSDGDAIIVDNYTGGFGSTVNGNVFYAKLSPFAGSFTADKAVLLYQDAGLTTPYASGSSTGAYGTSGTVEYFQASDISDFNYTWDLPEQSETLSLKANNSTIVEYTSSNVTLSVDLIAGTVDADTVNLKQFNETTVALGNVSGDISSQIDSANGTIYTATLTGGVTINSIANAVAGTSTTIILTQDGTGSHTLTSSMLFAGGSKTLSTGAGDVDIISVLYDGSNYYASLTRNYS